VPQSWFSFTNSTDDKSVEIFIYDVIGSYNVSAKSFIAELKRAGNKDATLRIHCPGGNILEGNAIYNAVKRYPGPVHVVIDGIAASMASVVAMAGDTIEIAENGLIMIHNPAGFGGGDSRDMRKLADVMDKLKQNIITAYADRTGLSREKLAEMMDDETWMTAAEALANKFVDLIGKKSDAKNTFDLSGFRNCALAVDTFGNAKLMDAKALAAKIIELEDAAKLWKAVEDGLKQAKIDAEAKVTIAEQKATDAEAKVTGLTTRAETAEASVKNLQGEVGVLTTRATTAEAEVKTLKAGTKTADERAREIAAAAGVVVIAKTDEGLAGGVAADGKALFEAYNKLMTEGKSADATAFWAANEKALLAYSESLTKKSD
jgi:ATP-dependent protease ClpP protease subunit